MPPPRPTGFFEGEILAVEVPGGRAGPVKVAEDEHRGRKPKLAALARFEATSGGRL